MKIYEGRVNAASPKSGTELWLFFCFNIYFFTWSSSSPTVCGRACSSSGLTRCEEEDLPWPLPPFIASFEPWPPPKPEPNTGLVGVVSFESEEPKPDTVCANLERNWIHFYRVKFQDELILSDFYAGNRIKGQNIVFLYLSLAFNARARSFLSRSSDVRRVTSCFAFSRTFIPWSLLSSKYWKSFSVCIAKIFSLHCWATWKYIN